MARNGGKTISKEVNECEQQRLMTIQANKELLQSMGIIRLASSLTSLVESTKENKRKQKRIVSQEDDDYVLEDEPTDKESENQPMLGMSTRVKTSKIKEGQRKNNFIPPMQWPRVFE